MGKILMQVRLELQETEECLDDDARKCKAQSPLGGEMLKSSKC